MMKLENPGYKIVQYVDGFSGDWGLGFSMMNINETNGWEFNPTDKRKVSRNEFYKISHNVDYGNVTFSYGFENED